MECLRYKHAFLYSNAVSNDWFSSVVEDKQSNTKIRKKFTILQIVYLKIIAKPLFGGKVFYLTIIISTTMLML